MSVLVRCPYCGDVICALDVPEGVPVKVSRDRCHNGKCRAKVSVQVLTQVDIPV